MLLTPAPARRRRALAHACATCHRPWALRALRSPDGVYRLVCRFCSAGQDAAGARTTPGALPHDHELLLAADDAELVRSLADLVEEGLRAGEPCVVIATAPHRDALRDRLRADVLAAAARRGAFVELDAADTLQLFLRDGRPDAALFEGTVGAFLRDPRRRGPGPGVRGVGRPAVVGRPARRRAGARGAVERAVRPRRRVAAVRLRRAVGRRGGSAGADQGAQRGRLTRAYPRTAA